MQIEMNQIRHMVYDVSCIEKNLDLRIMLSTQRTLTSLHVSRSIHFDLSNYYPI